MGQQDFDIVVMGSGAAGLTAALFAAERGAKVLILEKADLVGGTTAISGGQVWMPNNRFLPRDGVDGIDGDSPALAMQYLAEVTLGEVEPGLLQCLIEAGPRMV